MTAPTDTRPETAASTERLSPSYRPWPLPEPHGARSCGCFACALVRRERGLYPVPIRIGEYTIQALPPGDRP